MGKYLFEVEYFCWWQGNRESMGGRTLQVEAKTLAEAFGEVGREAMAIGAPRTPDRGLGVLASPAAIYVMLQRCGGAG